ncbi:unnamed protein product [Anisakis simplex]|uniref:Uncharacterized protein n=1 Tax=Anisakis simplex TaxID=6269 RepID=A0A0M3JAD7_ANISI|nr:unnamed protein product [Anisakis simplex]
MHCLREAINCLYERHRDEAFRNEWNESSKSDFMRVFSFIRRRQPFRNARLRMSDGGIRKASAASSMATFDDDDPEYECCCGTMHVRVSACNST